ncbi:MAG: polysaccharide ABC transporter ATP-binding protein [Deltaproteobacteria bacterium]
MNNTAIRINGIGKEYKIGKKQEYRTIRDTISDIFMRNLNRLPFYSNKETDDAPGGSSKSFWSLRNISFNVGDGEIIGIIGRNGAGKSTLLKIISGITDPSEGRIEIFGRIGSLLEVGTGFHQELTGRENIYLNGAILGMKRLEIDRKFDEIVAFSDIEEFIDTPVKRYSSGMRVRLGFSVAAHLEPEILLIDEVLAVGDAAFQKKCLGKLDNVATSEGRTVLFVSHDMTAILSLCHKAVLLENGQLSFEGSTDKVVQQYLQNMSSTYETPLDQREDRGGNQSIIVTSLKIENAEAGKPIRPGSKLAIEIGYRSRDKILYPHFLVKIRDFRTRATILRLDSDMTNGLPEVLQPEGVVKCLTDEIYMTPGRCTVDIEIKKGMVTADRIEYAGYFDIETEDLFGSGKIPSRNQAMYLAKYKWSIEND